MNRLTDNDKHWGPFTFGKTSWKRISAIISSEAYEGPIYPNTLTIYAFGWIVRVKLPSIIKPFSQKVIAGWDEATVQRMGRNYYYNYFDREYGFSLSDGDFFQLYYGISSGMGNLPEGVKEQNWCKHLPWKQWTHVRHSLYDNEGYHYWTELDKDRKKGFDGFDDFWKMKETCPKSKFLFEDYDGERIVATCTIEEREWHKGEKLFAWLKYFYPPKINRSLDLSFSSEVGPQKGSWKGGTIGHSINMFKGESSEKAFKRYCDIDHERKGRSFKLKFIGPIASTHSSGVADPVH